MNNNNSTRSAQVKELAVYLNHLFLVPDEQTYQDISQSGFLMNEFSGFAERTTVSSNESWAGTYLYGETTYMEFLKAEEPSGPAEGNCGIGFGVDRPDELKAVQERLQEQIAAPVTRSLTTNKRGTGDIPWFHSIGVDYPDLDWSFHTWVMEYHADYLKRRYPDLSHSEVDITRKKYNSHQFNKERYFGKVIGISLALPAGQADRFAEQLVAFGYDVRKVGKQEIFSGPEIEITVIRDAATSGVTELTLSLMRKKTGQMVYRFGSKSKLTFNSDMTAIWTF